MTTEIKPGKWRLKDGREIVVTAKRDGQWAFVGVCGGMAGWKFGHEFEHYEYLGPAVIGEATPYDTAYWVMLARESERQCKDLEAETAATRELLEQSEERCEELAKALAESDEAFRRRTRHLAEQGWAYKTLDTETTPYNSRAHEAETKLASAQCVIEGLEERVRFLEQKSAGMPEVSDENGVKVHRYKSVTVMVRGEREALCRETTDRWWSGIPGTNTFDVFSTREDSEQWCREQLEPKWREATEGDVGKACRVRDDENESWLNYDRLVAVIDHACRFVVSDDDGSGPWCYPCCEVQE